MRLFGFTAASILGWTLLLEADSRKEQKIALMKRINKLQAEAEWERQNPEEAEKRKRIAYYTAIREKADAEWKQERLSAQAANTTLENAAVTKN